MTFSLPAPRLISLLVAFSIMTAYMIVNQNHPSFSLTINEYFVGVGTAKEPSLNSTIGNQTKIMNKKQPVDDDDFSSRPEMPVNEMQEVEKANSSVVVSGVLNESVNKSFDGDGVASSSLDLVVLNSSAFAPGLTVDEMPPALFVDDELHGGDQVNDSVSVTDQDIAESNRSVSMKNVTRIGGEGKFSLDLPVQVAAFSSPPSKSIAKSESRSCDIYRGKWNYDPSGPLYTNNTCPILAQAQNCQGNGRPDKNYENWRWKPDQCDLPRFDARKFLELMRGKTLAFVGDSLARNQMESLLCILWQVEAPIKGGNRHIHRWYFRSTSTTIARVWSAWLVRNTALPIPSSSPRAVNIHIDTPDQSLIDLLPNFDITVLSSGHWFSREPTYMLNGTVVNRQTKRSRRARKKQLDIVKLYGMAMQTALSSITSLPNYKGLTIFRSYSPGHYEGGAWNTGGSCAGVDRPSSKSVRSGSTNAMVKKQVAEVERAARNVRNGSKLRFMDITGVAGYRHDGHPGPYSSLRSNAKNSQRGAEDCVHWCMPGPVDTWNEILYEILKREV